MEVPVFTETSLGTRVALAAPPDITAAEFKRTLEREYFGGFPESGPVRVHGLMVRRRSCFYHLPDSMPVKYAFNGAAKAWFLHANLTPSDDLTEPSLHDCTAMEDHSLKGQRHAIHSDEKKGRDGRLESCYLISNGENKETVPGTADSIYEPERRGNPDLMDETTSENSSAISVGGIIKRYFCSDEVVDSIASPISKSKAVQNRVKEQANASARFAVKTLPRSLNIARDKSERRRIGKRLVAASYVLGVSPTQKTVQSLCRSQKGKLPSCSRGVKCPVFDLSDSSDNESNT
ncbi:hypothetical protein SAY87_010755 [Trapa incisa]|uniref:Uncharacterized protein n=1 Tax=Trapa incisa TaxID=236973 RepID=A0AAN7JIM1_9MYRT|nr:hypothetical protein SAY87_010755 [Trapa incisa]